MFSTKLKHLNNSKFKVQSSIPPWRDKIQNYIKYFFFFLPILKFKIKEKSMEPTLRENQTVLVNRYYYIFRRPKIGEIIVIKDPTLLKLRGTRRYMIKRIEKIDKDKVFVIGDNKTESIDSRKFGWIDKRNIVGKVIILALFVVYFLQSFFSIFVAWINS